MTTFLLIPGSDGRAWYWHRVIPELESRGHRGIAVDLPQSGSSDLADYADTAVAVARGVTDDLVVVGQSLGAFTAPLLVGRVPMRQLILVNPMIPAPGESGGDWWQNVGHPAAYRENAELRGLPLDFELMSAFFHDVPPSVTAEAMAGGEGAVLDTVFSEPWPLPAWPDVPTTVLQGADDRFFPLEFQRRLAAERLEIEAIHLVPGGHLNGLSRPIELAEHLIARSMEHPSAPHSSAQR